MNDDMYDDMNDDMNDDIMTRHAEQLLHHICQVPVCNSTMDNIEKNNR